MPVTAFAPEALAEVRLACVPNVGPRGRQALLDRFGTPTAVFAAPQHELANVAGIGPKRAAAIMETARSELPRRTLELCADRDVAILRRDGEGYPALLATIHDPPGLLFVRGELLACDALAVAIVGSRHATAYGRRMAWQLAGSPGPASRSSADWPAASTLPPTAVPWTPAAARSRSSVAACSPSTRRSTSPSRPRSPPAAPS
jgi:hypothetical protein